MAWLASARLPVRPLLNYGGQAVLEGVMMRGDRTVAVAVRSPGGQIEVQTRPLGKMYPSGLSRIPFLRGLLLLWDTLVLGLESLAQSARVLSPQEPLEAKTLGPAFAFALLLAVGLFMLLPAGLGQYAERAFHLESFASNLIEGGVRLTLLLGYLAAIGRLPDIARMFAYHGAEHKTIAAYEAGAELTPTSVARYSRRHPRCGTSLLVALVLLAIVVFSLLGPMSLALRLATRILALPILLALGYEYLRWTGGNQQHLWARVLAGPGVWVQALTTREPDTPMLEVAIAAFTAMRAADDTLDLPGSASPVSSEPGRPGTESREGG